MLCCFREFPKLSDVLDAFGRVQMHWDLFGQISLMQTSSIGWGSNIFGWDFGNSLSAESEKLIHRRIDLKSICLVGKSDKKRQNSKTICITIENLLGGGLGCSRFDFSRLASLGFSSLELASPSSLSIPLHLLSICFDFNSILQIIAPRTGKPSCA